MEYYGDIEKNGIKIIVIRVNQRGVENGQTMIGMEYERNRNGEHSFRIYLNHVQSTVTQIRPST